MAVDAMLAQVQSDMQSAAAQVQAATDYANSLPPLPNFEQQTTPRPVVQWGCPISRLRLISCRAWGFSTASPRISPGAV